MTKRLIHYLLSLLGSYRGLLLLTIKLPLPVFVVDRLALSRAARPRKPAPKGPKAPRGPELTHHRGIRGAVVVVAAAVVVAQEAAQLLLLLLLMVLLGAALYGIRSVEISTPAAGQM